SSSTPAPARTVSWRTCAGLTSILGRSRRSSAATATSTTPPGLDGLIRRLGGTVNLPVLIHPHFWRRRRVAIPGRDHLEIPTTSRSALTGAGFEVIEEGHPSFLFHRSVLVT